MKKQNSIKMIAGLGSLLLSHSLLAAEATPVQMGDFQAWTTIDVSLEQDDNPFRQAADEESSTVFRATPSISLTNNSPTRDIEFGYAAELVSYFDSSDDSYLSHNLDAGVLFKASALSSFGVKASYTDGNEARGTGSTEGTLGAADGPTEFTEASGSLAYYYGSNNNPFSSELSLSVGDIEFDNFREVTRQRDRSYTGLAALFDYKYSVATSVFLDLSYKDNDYSTARLNSIALDNEELTAHVGFAWSATRSTTGRAGFGVTTKDVSEANDDRTFTSWNVAVDWEPTRSDIVSFMTDKSSSEAAGIGLYVINATTELNWSHDISSAWSFNVFGLIQDSTFENNPREDETISYGLNGLYRFNRQMDLSVGYEYEDKDSSFDEFDYERNVISATLSIGL